MMLASMHFYKHLFIHEFVCLAAELYASLLTKKVLINQLRRQHKAISEGPLSPNEGRGEVLKSCRKSRAVETAIVV